MDLLIATQGEDPGPWITALAEHLPEARCRVWQDGDNAAADFLIVWRPAANAMGSRPNLRAIFNLGAGVDALMRLNDASPGALPSGVPLIRVENAGMAAQMVEYVLYALLRHFRRFDDYAEAQSASRWAPLTAFDRDEFPVAILGLGELGIHVARAVAALGFPVRGWSRTAKTVEGVVCYAGEEGLDACLDGVQLLVSLLPDTPQTRNLIDATRLGKLARGAALVNVARGTQVVDKDLLAAIADGQISRATLDVFHAEPLAPDHPFWKEPRVTVTPHVAAKTMIRETSVQIAGKIKRILAGLPVQGIVDHDRGY